MSLTLLSVSGKKAWSRESRERLQPMSNESRDHEEDRSGEEETLEAEQFSLSMNESSKRQ